MAWCGLLGGELRCHPHRAGDALQKTAFGHHRGEVGDHPQPWRIKAFGAHVDADEPLGRALLKSVEPLSCAALLRVHQINAVAIFFQQGGDGLGMVDVAGDHQPGGIGVLQTHLLEFALGPQQQLLANTATELNEKLNIGLKKDNLLKTGGYNKHTQKKKLKKFKREDNSLILNYSEAEFEVELGTN